VPYFILRSYYFLKDETGLMERLAGVFLQNSLSYRSQNPPQDFLEEQTGFIYTLQDAAGKMMILTVKTRSDAVGWAKLWEQLHAWEIEAGYSIDEVMGKLTLLVGPTGNWAQLAQEASRLVPGHVPGNYEPGSGPLDLLFDDKKKCEALYVYALDSSLSMAVPFLSEKMPILHGQMIHLQMLDNVLNERYMSIRREKEEMERDLIRILHTKLVMNQSSLLATEELERDIEVLATAFAKLLEDQKMISEGIKRLESMLEGVDKQILQEPVLRRHSSIFHQMIGTKQERLGALRDMYEELNLVQDNHQAAIEVVQTKVQVMNNRTNIATQEQIKSLLEINTVMQKKSLVFQYAAGLIEFVVLAYYGLNLWSGLAHEAYAAIPSWIRFIVIVLFSGNTVQVTHLLAEYMQGDTHVIKKLRLYCITLLLILIGLVAASMLMQSQSVAY
jgi:hypothetical protein